MPRRACPQPRVRATSASAASGATAKSSPPDVCASASSSCSSVGVVPQSTKVETNAWLRCVPPATKPSRTSARTPSITGTAARSTRAPTPEPRASSPRCPSSPKPVTSVAPCTASPSARPASRAPAFSVVITFTAVSSSSAVAPSRLTAVEITPSPIGFVRTRTSPARPPALRQTRSGSTVPTTARPYFGSGSSIECPPAISAPAWRATSLPPSMTRASSSNGNPSRGQATRLRPSSGEPPIAYTSDSAFVAAIRPQSYASSTIGVKKSVVTTRARSSRTRYTAASSAVSRPTIRFGSSGGVKPRTSPKTVRRSSGESLQAQPAPWEKRVSRSSASSRDSGPVRCARGRSRSPSRTARRRA